MPSTFDYAGYWDKKLEYFKKTEDLSNTRSDVASGDVIGELIELMDIKPGDVLLDLGCGYGRLFPFFLEKGATVYGVDVSPCMLDEARKTYAEDSRVSLSIQNAEELDFADSFFDQIICYGIFDALEYQYDALKRMAEVLKPGGRLLISGKHKPYFDDDQEAITAEVKAAEVGHPNFFTVWSAFSAELKKNSLEMEHPFFYLRRGDSANNVFVTEVPPVFYDYNIVLKKA